MKDRKFWRHEEFGHLIDDVAFTLRLRKHELDVGVADVVRIDTHTLEELTLHEPKRLGAVCALVVKDAATHDLKRVHWVAVDLVDPSHQNGLSRRHTTVAVLDVVPKWQRRLGPRDRVLSELSAVTGRRTFDRENALPRRTIHRGHVGVATAVTGHRGTGHGEFHSIHALCSFNGRP